LITLIRAFIICSRNFGPGTSARFGSYRLGVRRVGIPVPNVLCGDCRAADEQQVFGIPLLCRSGEIKAAGDHGLAVDDHYAAVS